MIERNGGSMEDMISRKAAIDALNEQIGQCDKALSSFDITMKDEYAVKVERASLVAYKEQLEALPSAQPETHDKRTETHACDCISRQAAIKVIDSVFPVDPMKSEYAQGIACGAALAKTYVEQLPSAQQRWIPCSERLPDEYGNYLISIKGEEPDIGTINPNDPRGWSLCDANGFYWANDKMLNIIAWMPLPEPYAERRTDE